MAASPGTGRAAHGGPPWTPLMTRAPQLLPLLSALRSCRLVPSPDPRPWGPATPQPPHPPASVYSGFWGCLGLLTGLKSWGWVQNSRALRLRGRWALLRVSQDTGGPPAGPRAGGAEALGSPRAPTLGAGGAACNRCRMLRGGLSTPGAVLAEGMLLRGSLSPGTRLCVCGGAVGLGPGPSFEPQVDLGFLRFLPTCRSSWSSAPTPPA